MGSSWHFSVYGFVYTFPTFVILALGLWKATELVIGLVS